MKLFFVVFGKRTAKSLGTQASCLREAGWKPANPGAGKMPAFPRAGKMPAFPEVPSISTHFEQCSSLVVFGYHGCFVEKI